MNHDSAEGAMEAFRVVNPAGSSRLILTCDHAGNHGPAASDALGLPESRLAEHIAWDIGAASLTQALANRLDAQAVLAMYSRLFIDPNRKLGSPDSILRVSDGVMVPGNQNVTPEEAVRRAELSFWPYHHEVEKAMHLTEHEKSVAAYVAVHSFTPRMAGAQRPWDVGVLYGRDERMARPLLAALQAVDGICVGDNQPYSAAHPPGYGLEAYGTSAGRPHVMIEVRQDLISDDAGVDRWAGIIATALAPFETDSDLFVKRFFR
jgi:predicted N-formylglutamate amidohydrolase